MNKKILLSLLTVLTILFLTAQTCQFAVVNTGLAADCEGEGDVVCNEDSEAYQCQIAEYGLGYYVTRMDQTSDTEYCGAEEAAAEEEPEEDKDSDEDGIFDSDDVCDGYDDVNDYDSDGTPDGCDDSDGDGLSDYEELNIYGTDPDDSDSDDDGISDGKEVDLGTDLLDSDTDDDGLTDEEEDDYGADPTDADTDDDGLLDGEEVTYETSPERSDTDGDGLSDYDEVKTHITEPTDIDSDDDGVSDGDEVADGTDPLAAPSTTAYEAMDISSASSSAVSAARPYFANKEKGLSIIMAYLDETDGSFHDSDGGNPTAASPLFISVSRYFWESAGELSEELVVTIVTDNADSSRLKIYLPQLAADALGSDATYMAFYIADDGSTYYADAENDGVNSDKSDLLTPEEALTADHLARASEGQPTFTLPLSTKLLEGSK